ncbi:pentatricopeptide repeat-containing protein At4g04790, mitochondrial-like isoform X2 [Magnolia sinica]|uniref:pentatricopeptide repeat-containing protein At4g04790, mitochondrial-like isoform X2 n=1 Tax=Magnolia sinica TaxID=86752 RepID=UPI002658C5FF|nr:pentatricopeptide repeat-containing protein At4g04790, mitochondrial-like isoform X2 [Magnolia sinica]
MRGPESKKLSSIFGSALKNISEKSDSNPLAAAAATDKTIKELISLPSSSSSSSSSIKSSSGKPLKSSKKSARVLSKPSSASLSRPKKSRSETRSETVDLDKFSLDSGNYNSPGEVLKEISSILRGNNSLDSLSVPASKKPDVGKSLDKVLDMPWFSNMSQTCISLRRKELSRERKQKWIFKNTQTHRFEGLVRMCAQKLGTEATLEVFGKLGRETGVKEYNALIKICIEKARQSNDEEISLDEIQKAFQLFRSMREQGFQLEEESYSPLLMYLIDMGMIEEFHFFCGLIKDENPGSFSRLGYYEMLLWIRVNNEDKVQELCNSVVDSIEDSLDLAVSYLLALCETDKEELLQLLEVVDMTKISSMEYVTTIFKSLGRLLLENFAEKFFLAFKISEAREEDISSFIYNYVISMPNLAVEEVISKFKDLHEKLEVLPSSASYDKLITYCCNSLQVHAALDIVDQMCQSGLALSVETFQPILRASEQSFELDLVHPIYSVIRHYDLKPKGVTFKSMISLCVKMKDFEGAYNMLKDVEEMNITPTANMYNAIMAGYFREKNIPGGLMVLRQMELANVKPDSETFSYLIGNCECEEDIVKYHDKLQRAGVQVTKHVYMALINAYSNCGQFEKAKQVVLHQGIPVKNINEIKSALVSALTSNGQILDALEVYEEIKQAGCHLEAKAIICLIENLRSEGELDKLLQLLGELNDFNSWFDGCSRVVLYCARYKLLSSAVELLKQLKEKDELATSVVFDQIFSQALGSEPTDLETGLSLLQSMKEDLDLRPSRTSLDFLLSACVSAKDPCSAELIWEEYKKAGLSFNVLTFLRKYQVLLASGKHTSAAKLLKKIQKDDPHVRCIINACNATYWKTTSTGETKKNSQIQRY